MIRCVARHCTWKSQSIHRLHDHLKKYHGHLDEYECNIGDCTRKYSVKYSFYRHLNKHFEETDNTINESIVEEHNIEDSFVYAETPTPNHNTIEEINVDMEDTPEDTPSSDERTDCSMYTNNLNLMIKQMENASINFNLKYLSANTLPRKVVFDMHQDIHNMFLNPLSNIVKLMEPAGCITAEGKIMFDEIFDNMHNSETEYKFVQQLKVKDLYAEPREFVLSNELRPGIVRNEQQMSNDPITGKTIIYYSSLNVSLFN